MRPESMRRKTLGAYFGLYPKGLRKAVLRVSKGYRGFEGTNTVELISQFTKCGIRLVSG